MGTAFCMEGILHDPAYLLGSSYLPQLTCFPLANLFEILYNRIDMTGGLASQASSVSLSAMILRSYALHGLAASIGSPESLSPKIKGGLPNGSHGIHFPALRFFKEML